MWILFIFNGQNFSTEFEGDETLNDVANILNETYNFEKDLYYYVNGTFISERDYFIPLNEVPELKGKEFIKINLVIHSLLDDESPYVSPFVRQEKYISIGGQYDTPLNQSPSYSNRQKSTSRTKKVTQEKQYDTTPQKHVTISSQEFDKLKIQNNENNTIDNSNPPELIPPKQIKVTLPSGNPDLQAPRKIDTQDNHPTTNETQQQQLPQQQQQQQQKVAAPKIKLPNKPQSPQAPRKIDNPRQVSRPTSNRTMNNQPAHIRASHTSGTIRNQTLQPQKPIIHPSPTSNIAQVRRSQGSRQSAAKSILKPQVQTRQNPMLQATHKKKNI